jgi:segregation and condensation protein A
MTDITHKDSILFSEDETYKVRLEGFEGPLELLLLLIRKHKYDIYDIPIALILVEYLGVIEDLEEFDIDLAGEFLVMAATLAQIKSRMLLPKISALDDGEEGEDPRAELVRRLLDYERFREVALGLSERPLLGRDVFIREQAKDAVDAANPKDVPVEANLMHLLLAFKDVLKEASEEFVHEVAQQRMTTQEAIIELLEHFEGLEEGVSIRFRDLFPRRPKRARIVALFMGVLELIRMRAISFKQANAFGEIRVFVSNNEEIVEGLEDAPAEDIASKIEADIAANLEVDLASKIEKNIDANMEEDIDANEEDS